jgi:uncharacterized membrane protein YhhN
MQIQKKKLILHLIFTVIVLCVLTNPSEETTVLEFVCKPMIMIWIAGYFLLYSRDMHHPVFRFALFAFFFSWLGDVALMFDGISCFLSGITAFLVAHLFYILTFLRPKDRESSSLLRKKPLWILPFAIYGVVMMWILFPKVNAIIKPAVILYTLTLLVMAGSALNRRNKVSKKSYFTVLGGAILFVFSDSLIAINKFAVGIPKSGIWIMTTYILAQYLIMSGLLTQVNGTKKAMNLKM